MTAFSCRVIEQELRKVIHDGYENLACLYGSLRLQIFCVLSHEFYTQEPIRLRKPTLFLRPVLVNFLLKFINKKEGDTIGRRHGSRE